MSSFAKGQLYQLGDKLQAAEWTAEDVTNFGQATRERLIKIRDSFRSGGDIIAAIEEGRTELWLHPGQTPGRYVNGRDILRRLTDDGLLDSCADKAQLESIQAKGIDFWRKYFAGKVLPAWRDVGGGSVWYLCEDGGRVLLGRHWVGYSFDSGDPALRLRK